MNQKQKINLAVMAHVDAGKTTVTEEFLYHSGAKKVMGNVDQGTTTTDSLSIEKKRGITVRSATVSFTWKDIKINLIDTPGHMDFIAEVERSLSVLDGAVLVISAKEGVQPQTRAIFERLKKLKIPTVIFLNKIDRMGVKLEEIRKQIEEELTKDCVYLQETYEDERYQLQIKEHEYNDEYVVSQLIFFDEFIYEQYFSNPNSLENNTCKQCIYELVQKGTVYPIYYGSALKNIGMDALLDGIVTWLCPSVNPSVLAPFDRKMERKELEAHLNEELSAYVYKIEGIAKSFRKAYIRVYSGGLMFKQRVRVYDSEEILVVNMYCALEDGKEVETDVVAAGDMCVLYGSGTLKCGQWLGKPTPRRGLEQELNPLLSVAVHPKEPERRVETLDALLGLELEDPYLSVNIQEEEVSLRLFGRLQEDIIRDIMLERYQLELVFDEMKPVIKERPLQTVTTAIWMGETFDDISKALFYVLFNPYHAGIQVQLEPLPKGSGIQYESQVSYGDLEKSFQNAVREGALKGLMEGLGHEVVDAKVTFIDMQYNSVMSTPADYRNLAKWVVMRALKDAEVEYIQPYMKFTARVPLGYEKYIMGKLIEIHALVLQSEFIREDAIYYGEVALAEVKDMALDIKMYTEGKGSFELEFLDYR